MILLWYIFFVIALRGLQDAWLRGIEHTLRDNLKPDYDRALIDKNSTSSSYAEFSAWYVMVALALAFIADSFIQWLVNFSIIALLQLLCGNEDFWCYFFEPIFQHPRRDERYPVKIWIWRFPIKLHWLGEGDGQGHSGWHNPLLMWVAGRQVYLKGFLTVVFISMALTIVLSLIT
jgi:hypothetical protein